MKLNLAIIPLLFLAVLNFARADGTNQDSNVTDEQKLQGTWQLVYQQSNGQKLPDEMAAEMFHGRMVFAGDKVRYTVELPGFDLQFSYKLNSEQQPKAIDLELVHTPDDRGIGVKMLGIYLLEGKTLKICYNKSARPTDFSAGEGSQNTLVVLKRKSDEPVTESYVYVSGGVHKAGRYDWIKGMTLVDAIDAAGGFTESAELRVGILHLDGVTESYPRGSTNAPPRLKAGDKIYVPKRLF